MRNKMSFLALLAACAPETSGSFTATDAEHFSSDQATLMEFEFEGELFVPTSPWNVERTIEDQLLYSIGHLNGDRAVGRLDTLELSNLRTTSVTGGKRIQYHAVLPVGWGKKTNLPTAYTFTLPKKVDSAGLEAFTTKYKEKCVDLGAHDVDAGSMWYYFRPKRSGCVLDPADVVSFAVTVSVAAENTTGKYPEYHQVWKDNALDVVAIFGKYEDGATTSADAGIAAYNAFVASIKTELGAGTTTQPATIPASPGVAVPDVSFTKQDGARRITITALLVDNVRTAGATFDARYEGLSTNADLISYNGHAGLGANVRALAQKGEFVAGKYQLFFMNGCDTFAYVDGSLAQTRALLNSDDPSGTKYMDMVTNAMPAYFQSMSNGTLALIRGLLAQSAPKTFDQMFRSVDSQQVVVVTGEEDNVYYPGYVEGGGTGWTGLNEAASVARGEIKRWQTPPLPAGDYVVQIKHDPQRPGGDADLYVKTGADPERLQLRLPALPRRLRGDLQRQAGGSGAHPPHGAGLCLELVALRDHGARRAVGRRPGLGRHERERLGVAERGAALRDAARGRGPLPLRHEPRHGAPGR